MSPKSTDKEENYYIADLYESDNNSVSSVSSSVGSLDAKKIRLEEDLWDEAIGGPTHIITQPPGDISSSCNLDVVDLDRKVDNIEENVSLVVSPLSEEGGGNQI